MEAVFDENFRKCLEYLKSENYPAATSALYPISKKLQTLGSAKDEEVIKFTKAICNVLNLLTEKVVSLGSDLDRCRHLFTDTYRILRNSCGANPKVQEQLGRVYGEQLMKNSAVMVDAVTKHFSGEILVQSLAVIIQFLCNLGVNMEENQDLVWDHFKGYLKRWLDMAKGEKDLNQERTIKILNLSCALVECCLPRQWKREERFLENPQTHGIMVAVIQAACGFSFDYSKKVLAKLMQVPDLMEKLNKDITPRERFVICNVLKEVINEWRSADEKVSNMPTIHSNLLYLATFLILARPTLTVGMLTDPKNAYQADLMQDLHLHVKMLEVMSIASCCQAFSSHLTKLEVPRGDKPKTLIEYAIGFLREIHEEGKKGYNLLSMTRNVNDVYVEHPAYLLRRDLVRLIANLSYQNNTVQDFVREYDGRIGLPVLLEHTVIDERNPFMAEWAKLALTNLVRDNEANAEFINGLSQAGHINGNRILKSCGLVVEKDGNKVTIRQEGSLPSLSKLSEKEPPRP